MIPFCDYSKESFMRKNILLAAGIVIVIIAAAAFLSGQGSQSVPSRSYVGHKRGADSQAIVLRYPQAAGTRLDDCQICHRGGPAGTDAEREYSPCSYCHLLVYPNARYKTGVPKNYEETLNPFGLDYKKAGRGVAALAAIESLDSDGDGTPNGAEIAALRNPGDPSSRPGQALAPTVRFTWDDLHKLPARTQFMLMNTTKESTDDYVNYSGVTLLDVLKAAGIDLQGATGVTVFAPDGYSIDVSLEDILKPFPQGYYYAGPRALAGTEQAFMKYPEKRPAGLTDGQKIPQAPWLLLAFERENRPLDSASYEKGTGRLTGEGPFRLIKPQRDLMGDPAKPGRPDRSMKAKTFGDGWDFNPAIDHNAGACVRGACVLRVNPMPAGFEEYDWKNGWPLIADRAVVVYGHGVKGRS
jgi:hypothetical protein